MNHPLSKRNRKRIEILQSAAAVFRRYGYHGTRVDEIARRLGMKTSNLYYYFRGKEEILFLCHDYSLDILLGLIKRLDAEPLSAVEKLHQLIVGFAHVIIDELQGTALALDLEDLPTHLLRKIITKRDRLDRRIRQLVKEGIAEGVFRPGDPKLLTFAILGAVNWIPRWFRPEGSINSDEIGHAFADYLVHGLLAPPRHKGRSVEVMRVIRKASRRPNVARVS
jgi:TetR/AcrR family transcriptional regulator